jgi:hypothetical protein
MTSIVVIAVSRWHCLVASNSGTCLFDSFKDQNDIAGIAVCMIL